MKDFEEIGTPSPPEPVATTDLVIHGPSILPQHRILLYSPEEWEVFVFEWAHYHLKNQYLDVRRYSGAGDHGIDIAGFSDEQKLLGLWDTYQCKRFLDHAIYPTEAWPEIGKILFYSFQQEYSPPRHYYFVSPRGVGTTLAGYLGNAVKLKRALIDNWDKHVRTKITDTQEIVLDGSFQAYVEGFDYSIFDYKTSLQLIDEHRKSPYHVTRFGGGLPSRPKAEKPPEKVAPTESRYVEQLLAAYADHKNQSIPNVAALKSWPNLETHFGRQREAFYHAESLRVFARDSVPEGTFEDLKDDIHSGVVDVCEANHPDGYDRVRKVTQAARELQLTSNALLTCTKPKDRDGICHQLANEDRLSWTKT